MKRPICQTCDDDGEVFSGSYHVYDDDGTPLAGPVYEPCPDCQPRATTLRPSKAQDDG